MKIRGKRGIELEFAHSHEENKDCCENAISRIRSEHPHDILFAGDVIAIQEREIEIYRRKIRYLEKELKEKTEEATLETVVAIEGIAVDDGIFHVSNGDTVIITKQRMWSKERIDEIVDRFAKYGVGCIVLAPDMNVIGAIEHEKTD